MYVGVAYEGASTSDAYNSLTVAWRKGSGDLYLHGVKIARARFAPDAMPEGPQSGGVGAVTAAGGFRNGDLVGVLVDAAAGKLAFFCNGVLQRSSKRVSKRVSKRAFFCNGVLQRFSKRVSKRVSLSVCL